MYLTDLPNETLFLIASYLECQQDVYALVRTNRCLSYTLYDYLYEYNSRYYHGSALVFVTRQGNIGRVEKLLIGLRAARTKSRFPPAPSWRGEALLEERWEDEDEWDSDEALYPFSRDISAHPLKTAGYSAADIVQIQKALLAAIEINHQEIITLLFNWGAQVNFYRGSLRNDKRMKRRSADPRTQDPPPLFSAVRSRNTDLVKYLLEKGADPDRYHPSPLYRAVEDGQYDIILLLLRHGAPLSYAAVLRLATQRRDKVMLQFLFENGIDAAVYGHRALLVASLRGDQEMIDLLRLKGADLEQLSEELGEFEDGEDEEDGDGMDGNITGDVVISFCHE